MARARLCARGSRILVDALVVLFDCELSLGGQLTKSGITRFDRWSMSDMGMFQQLSDGRTGHLGFRCCNRVSTTFQRTTAVSPISAASHVWYF